jgi:Raf kinase inhibitor-like YbhB/YbcL family protein
MRKGRGARVAGGALAAIGRGARVAGGALATLLALGGCGGLALTNPISPTPVRIVVSSPAFAAGGEIPPRFTCQGQDISPPLRLSGVPRRALELELVMRDRDAAGGNFIHWQLTGIPPGTRSLAAGQVPRGARLGRNSFGSTGYRGPCPPPGPAHHYVITVSARSGEVLLGTGTLSGTYARR